MTSVSSIGAFSVVLGFVLDANEGTGFRCLSGGRWMSGLLSSRTSGERSLRFEGSFWTTGDAPERARVTRGGVCMGGMVEELNYIACNYNTIIITWKSIDP